MKLEGFKKIDYQGLQAEIKKVYDPKEVPEIQIAAQINVKSVQTVKNAFNSAGQVVSDEILTNILNALGLNSFIIWQNGQRTYYIKN